MRAMCTPVAALAVLLSLVAGGASATCASSKSGCTACARNLCTACAAGWGLHSRGYCVQCTSTRSSQCATCNGSTPGTCLTCSRGWYLAGGKCQQCPAHCSACKDGTGACTRCYAMYHPHNGHCDIDCGAGRKGCAACRSGTCIKCQDPGLVGNKWVVWYMTPQGTCKQCQLIFVNNKSCQACDAAAPTRCTKCEDKAGGQPMWIDNNGFCQFCPGDCQTCVNGGGGGGAVCV